MARAELARRSGVPYPTLAGLENGDQKESTRLPALAEALGVNIRWLQAGKGPRDIVDTGAAGWADVDGFAQGAALGDGTVPEEWSETHKLKFREASLRRKGLKPQDLAVYYGSGDSMEPVIHDGDAIMFDRSDNRPKDDQLYVVRHDGHYFVKRLQKIGSAWCLVSENRDDPRWRKPRMIAEHDDFEIIGRVVWVARWLK